MSRQHYVISIYEVGGASEPFITVATLDEEDELLYGRFDVGLCSAAVRQHPPRRNEVKSGNRGVKCVRSYSVPKENKRIDVFRVTPFRTETELREAHEALHQLVAKLACALTCREEAPIEDIETDLDNMKEFLDAHT